MNEFGDIIGNDMIVKALVGSVLKSSVLHAYIFEGAEGSGKRLLANSFAKFIFCATKQSGCKCHSCTQFDSGNHSDLIYVRLREKEKSLGVEQIRETLINELHQKPFEYSHKVFIIESAELLTHGSQNALLRSIEEPPEYAVIILLAKDLAAFLPTVLSRCFIYKMRTFGCEYLLNHLKLLGYPEDKSIVASAYARSIGRAVSICSDGDFFEMRKIINDSLAILTANNPLAEFFAVSKPLEDCKNRSGEFAEIALMWFRDVLAYKATGDFAYVQQKDYATQIAESARAFSFKSLYKKTDGLYEFTRNLAANTPFAASLDALAVRLAE